MYPRTPGFKEPTTSRDSARQIKRRAETVRDRVADLYRRGNSVTPDQAADMLGISILTVRPRVSELVAQGKLVDTGRRWPNQSGHMAKIYRWGRLF